MRVSRGSKRSAVVGVLVMLAAAVGLGGAGPASAQEPPPGIVPEGHWAQVQIDWMVNWIAEVEEVMPANYPSSYTDGGSELRALGYYNFGATAPGGYDHWVNPSRLGDPHTLNPRYPESLIYQNVGGGTWELKAGMFMVPMAVEDLPPLIAWIPGWHGHPELCVGPDGTFRGITDPNNPNCPPGTTQATIPVMVHAWLEDPGCGHRFGGVGVGGLHCDVSHEH